MAPVKMLLLWGLPEPAQHFLLVLPLLASIKCDYEGCALGLSEILERNVKHIKLDFAINPGAL